MRCYKVSLVFGTFNMFRLEEQLDINGERLWQYIGLLDRNRVARLILLSITKDVQSATDMSLRFESHFLNLRNKFPRIITQRDVLNWLGEQVAAAI